MACFRGESLKLSAVSETYAPSLDTDHQGSSKLALVPDTNGSRDVLLPLSYKVFLFMLTMSLSNSIIFWCSAASAPSICCIH